MQKKTPLRQCVGCRNMIPKKELIRVIKTPEDTIELDCTGKKNGRGAYLCMKQECFDTAVKQKGIERSLKIKVPDEVYEQLKEELNQLETKK